MNTIQKTTIISLTVHSLILGLLLFSKGTQSSENSHDKPVVIDFSLINPQPPAQSPLPSSNTNNNKTVTASEHYTEHADNSSIDTTDSVLVDTETVAENIQTELTTHEQGDDAKELPSQTRDTVLSPSVAVNIYIKEKFSYISTIISSNIDYPYLAQVRHQEGTLLLSFVIGIDGSVSDVRVLKSSGFEILDKNAISTVKKSAPFPKPPCIAELKMPVAYKLM